MRIKIVIYCITLLMLSNFVSGGKVLDFIQKAHERNKETWEKVHEDFKEIFLPTTEKSLISDNAAENDILKVLTGSTPNIMVKTTEASIVSTTTPVNNNQAKESLGHNNDSIVFPTDEKVNKTSSSGVENTTKKPEGKENFQGNCESGYQRTSDGRCMPTY
ncbi:growth-blocking peptide, long form-like [Amyelois transitella]|uniref:growth-blocking peptide, long form-like n=1 Tax=Amyelois transitella TaxID=680683 RepID=UPI00067E4E7A|nr:growth-blocking peptide, long form-like [Amyelois transitella]